MTGAMTVQQLRRLLAPMNGRAHVVFCENPGLGKPVLAIIGAVETSLQVAQRDSDEAATLVDAVVLVSG